MAYNTNSSVVDDEQKQSDSKRKKLKNDHQKREFVKCVENLRSNLLYEKNKKANGSSKERTKRIRTKHSQKIFQLTKHFNYGTDPQKKACVSNLGRRKILPRLCSKDIDKAGDLEPFIGKDIKYSFCVKRCCYDEKNYRFPMEYSFNLAAQLVRSLTSSHTELSSFFEEAVTSYLVTERNKQCVLQANDVQIYLKRITQDALSSNMESRKNTNRVSYAPVLLTPITDTILMRIRCPIAGIGYFALPQHKVNKELNEKCSSRGCIHKIIHIHERYIKDVYIDFGFKTNHDTYLEVKLMHTKLQSHGDQNKDHLVLLSNENANSNNQLGAGYAPFHGQYASSMRVRHHPFKKLPQID